MAKIITAIDNAYRTNFIKTLYEFHKGNYLTDTVLVLPSKEIRAHKLILAASSDVFAAMFNVDMKEKHEGKVNLSNFGLTDKIVEDLIEYIYTGKLHLSIENVEDIIACANYFLMSSLREFCCEFLDTILTCANCLAIFSIVTRFRCHNLREKAKKMILQNFSLVMEGDQFPQLTFSEVFDLLSNDMLEIPNEDIVFKALMRWLEYDISRSNYFTELLECVRIQFLSDSYLSSLNLSQCESLIREATLAKQVYERSNGSELLAVGKNILPRRCLDTSMVIMTTGGYDGNVCLLSSFVFSLHNEKWGHLASMHISRHDHGTVTLRNRLFVIGGFNSQRGPLNSVEYYNSLRNEWIDMPPMSSQRKSLGVCAFDNKLFVSGGLDGNYNALDSVEFYNDELKVWTTFIPMNQPRYSHGLVGSEKGLFAIGGWKLTTVEHFNDGEWRMLSPMNVSRAGATSIIQNNKIYVFGGYSEANCVSSVEIYNIDTNIWEHGISSSLPRWRTGSAVVDNMIYIIGGRNSDWQYLDAVESYNLETDEWREEEPLPCRIMGLRCSTLSVPKHSLR